MTQLSRDVAVLEQARSKGLLPGRDLEVIEIQVARAEKKLVELTQADPVMRDFCRIPGA